MGDYLKLFETHSEYETYIEGQDAILPNVSYCEDQNDVHYNPIPPVQTLKVLVTTGSNVGLFGNLKGNVLEIQCDSNEYPLVIQTNGQIVANFGVDASLVFENPVKGKLLNAGYNADSYSVLKNEYNIGETLTDINEYTIIS